MKWMLSLLALATVVTASPGIPSQILPVNPGGIGGLFKGPNSEILIKGPDGSVITAANEGGEVHTGLLAGAPIVAAEPSVSVAPALEYLPSADLISALPVVSPVAVETVAVAAPAVESEQSSDVHGSSGRILTKGSKAIIAGPASTTIADGHGVVEAPAIASTVAVAPVLTPIVAVASALAPTISATAAPNGLLHRPVTPILATAGVQLGPTTIPLGVQSLRYGSFGSNSGRVPLGSPLSDVAIGSTVGPISAQPLGYPEASIGNVQIESLGIGNAPTGYPGYGNVPIGASVPIGTSIPIGTSQPIGTSIPIGLPISTPSLLPHQSGPSVNLHSTTINTLEVAATPTLAPQNQISSTPARPLFTPTPGPVINGVPSRINNNIDLGPQIQLTGQLNQLSINPALIPSANIIPPEIGYRGLVSSTAAPGISPSLAPSLEPSPRAPGLGSVALGSVALSSATLGSATTIPSSSVQRSEIDATVQVPLSVSTASPLDIRNEILIQQDPRLQGVSIHDPGLQGVSLQDPRLQNVNIQDPRLQRVDLQEQSVNRQDPRLQIVSLQDSRLQGVSLQDPRLEGLNLQDPRLQSVNVDDPRLQGVNLQDPRLQGVNLQDPRLQSVNVVDPRLQGVNLQDPRLRSENVVDPRLQGVNLQDPRLQGVSLQNTRLQNPNIQYPRLQSINLQDSRVQSVNVQDPRLQNVRLLDTRPQGFESQDRGSQAVPEPRLQSQFLQEISGLQTQTQPAPVQELVDVTPRSNSVISGARLSLASVQQQDILSAELAKSGIDASEVQLTSVPLSSVSRVVSPVVDSRGDLRSGLGGDLRGLTRAGAWNRWGRETKTGQ